MFVHDNYEDSTCDLMLWFQADKIQDTTDELRMPTLIVVDNESNFGSSKVFALCFGALPTFVGSLASFMFGRSESMLGRM
ncbi:hypothetical protein BG011_001685, partial [Mortierella polycephala]